MEPRTYALPALLVCSLILPASAHAAPGDASAKPPPATAPVKPVPPPASVKRAAPPLAATPGAVSPVSPVPPAPYTSLPSPSAPPAPSAPAAAKVPAAKSPVEAAVQQVVMLERGGRPIAVGTLLSGDGRILTALSPLTHGNLIDAHYPEGQIVRVKLSHSDRAWDLALLTPEGDARHAGLKASREPAPAAGTKLHAVSYVRDKQLGSTIITIKSKGTLRGGDSAELPDALELPFAPKPTDVGAPLVNDQGEVVAIVARACSPNDKLGCTLAAYAAPVSAVRNFLRSVPVRRGPWLGLEVVAFDAGVARGVRVAAVAPMGPAASAGLQAGPPGTGDVVLAVNGTPVATAEAFANAVESHPTSGSIPLRLMVLSGGRYREVSVMVRDPANPVRPSSNDRMYQSNPTRPVPPRPGSTPNPYR